MSDLTREDKKAAFAAQLLEEAVQVQLETGMTPRQLADERVVQQRMLLKQSNEIIGLTKQHNELLAALELSVSLLRQHVDIGEHVDRPLRFDLTDWEDAAPIFKAIAAAKGDAT